MNNVILRALTLTTSYQPLTNQASEVLTVIVRMPASNKKEAVFLGEGGAEVSWEPGTQFPLRKVNLADIKVKGRSGDLVIVVGGTW